MKTRKFWLLAPVVAALGCGHGAPGSGAARRLHGDEERLPRLEVVRPTHGPIERIVKLAATVEALKRVDLAARVPGVVSYLPDDVDLGRKVYKGETLLKLAVPELEAEKKNKEALLEQARKSLVLAGEALAVAQREVEETLKEEKRFAADVAYHQLRYSRIRELVRKRAQEQAVAEEAEKLLETAEAALAANRARVLTRRAKVRAAEAEQVVAARRVAVAESEVVKTSEQIAFATITAPFDGEVSHRWVDPGATIKDPGTKLLSVVQADRVRVLLDVPQRDVPLLRSSGQPDPSRVKVRIPALTEVGKEGSFDGILTRFSGTLDPITRTMRAEVELDNKTGYLKPGMYGLATITVEQRAATLTLPATALVQRGEGRVEVFAVTDTEGRGEEKRGVLRRIEVRRGIDDGRVVEIKGGLTGYELIVARGNGVVRAGDPVIAVPRAPETPVEKAP
jgi:RND family efflux transporter MFP subunit